jgi:hypothetical protein
VNLVRAAAAGRPVAVGARLLLLSPPSLRGIANVLAFLRSRVPPPEGARPGWLPPWAGEAAQAEYLTPLGVAMMLHAVTRRDQPGLTLDECAALGPGMDQAAAQALVDVFFGMEAGRRPIRFRRGTVGKGPGKGIEEVDFGIAFGAGEAAKSLPDALADLTADQFTIVRFGSDMIAEDELTTEEVHRVWQEGRRINAERKRREAEEAAAKADPTPPEAN